MDGVPDGGAVGNETAVDCDAANGAWVGIGKGVAATTGGKVVAGPFTPGPQAVNVAATQIMQKRAESKRALLNGDLTWLAKVSKQD